MQGERIVVPANERYELKPAGKKLDRSIVHTKNSLGFRGPEPLKDSRGVLKIVAVGGSTTECFWLSDGKDWPARLAGMLSASGRKVWVNNAGMNGFSTRGMELILSEHVLKLKPDVVLLLAGINDAVREGPSDFELEASRSLSLSSGYLFSRTLANKTALGAVVTNLYRYRKARQHQLVDMELDLAALKPVDVPPRDFQTELSGSLSGYRERIEKLVMLTREAGAKPVLLTQPALFGPAVDPATKTDLGRMPVKDLNGLRAWERLELFNDIVRAVGRSRSVDVIDLARTLPKDSRLFYDAVHFTNEGAERVAEAFLKSPSVMRSAAP